MRATLSPSADTSALMQAARPPRSTNLTPVANSNPMRWRSSSSELIRSMRRVETFLSRNREVMAVPSSLSQRSHRSWFDPAPESVWR